MSNALINCVAASSLPPTPRLVAYALANRANDTTGLCNPSVATIAQETGLSRRAIQKALCWMRDNSALSVAFTGSSSRYTLSLSDTDRGAPDAPGAPDAHAQEMRGGAHEMRTGGARGADRGAPDAPKPKEPNNNPIKPIGAEPKEFGDTESANAVTLEATLGEELQTLWKEWQDYRTSRATQGPKSKRLAWTEQAARMTARQIESAGERLPLQMIADRIRSAIAGNWQGLNLDKMDAPTHRSQATPTITF